MVSYNSDLCGLQHSGTSFPGGTGQVAWTIGLVLCEQVGMGIGWGPAGWGRVWPGLELATESESTLSCAWEGLGN
jgi:hypothetical protein